MTNFNNTNTIAVDVDGVRRSRFNSTGTLIHSDEEGICNFWRWFGESKAVDAKGRPVVVFHGTKAEFDEFVVPAWFSDKEIYADLFSAEWGDGERTADSKVIPVYLKVLTPFATSDWEVTEQLALEATWQQDREQEGFDGVFFQLDSEIEWIVFSASQIKSAVGNSGAFDPKSSSLRDQCESNPVFDECDSDQEITCAGPC